MERETVEKIANYGSAYVLSFALTRFIASQFVGPKTGLAMKLVIGAAAALTTDVIMTTFEEPLNKGAVKYVGTWYDAFKGANDAYYDIWEKM